MSLFAGDKERRVVPRWRDFRTTAGTGELDGISLAAQMFDDGGFFADKLKAWEDNKSVETAAELIAAAVVLGRRMEAAQEAARFVLIPGSRATTAVQSMAQTLLAPPQQVGISDDETAGGDLQRKVLRLQVRSLREQLVDTPRNAFLWVDLARVYATLGQLQQSSRAMDRALKLVGSNRFVLRSASRLFVHLNEADRADDILRRNEVTRHDPWVLAAHIAVASVAGRVSPFVKTARRLVESAKHPPSHLAELASAIATLDLAAGDLREARRLFRQSLADPTENAVAQAGWAARRMSGVDVSSEVMRMRRSFEARAFREFYSGQWQAALRNAGNWLLDEPYSSRPALLGSYIAAVATEDHRLAESFARRGLLANPEEPILLNNLVFALANRGALKEAEAVFRRIPPKGDNMVESTLLATEGLLAFRHGDLEAGRFLYLRAIQHATQPEVRALAALHLAREEILVGSPGAGRALQHAEFQSHGLERADIRGMLESLRSRLARAIAEQPAP